jgi:hypothetical protein
MGNIFKIVEELSGHTGLDANMIQMVLSVIGGEVKSSLAEKQSNDGDDAAENLINQFAGTSPDSDAVDALFTPETQGRIGEVLAERTGLDENMIQGLLPTVVPIALNFLRANKG